MWGYRNVPHPLKARAACGGRTPEVDSAYPAPAEWSLRSEGMPDLHRGQRRQVLRLLGIQVPCFGRAVNRVQAQGLDLAPGEGEKWRELWLGPMGKREFLTWLRPCLGALRGLLRELSLASLDKDLLLCSLCQILMKRGSLWL